MPKMSGLEASPLIAKLPGNTRVQIFTMHESERITNDVKMAGAHGYVQKSQAGRDLVVAIEALLAGGTFFGPKTKPNSSKSGNTPNSGLSFCWALCCNWMNPKIAG